MPTASTPGSPASRSRNARYIRQLSPFVSNEPEVTIHGDDGLRLVTQVLPQQSAEALQQQTSGGEQHEHHGDLAHRTGHAATRESVAHPSFAGRCAGSL